MSLRTQITDFSKNVINEFKLNDIRNVTVTNDYISTLCQSVLNPTYEQRMEGNYLFKKYDEINEVENKILNSKKVWQKIFYYLGISRNDTEKQLIQAKKTVREKFSEHLKNRIDAIQKETSSYIQKYQTDANERSWQGRFSTYKTMSKSLKVIVDRLNQSKTIKEKFVTFFVKSEREKLLKNTINKVEVLRKDAEHQYRQNWFSLVPAFINFALSTESVEKLIASYQEKVILSELNSPENKAKLAAFRVMGKNNFPGNNWWENGSKWDGMNFLVSAYSIRKDIETYLLSSKKLTKESRARVEQVLRTLKDFETMIGKVELCKHDKKERLTAMIADIAFEFRSHVENLEVGESCIIPGGYYNTEKEGGHAVLYAIRRENTNSFSFTVINTGEGIEKLFNLWDVLRLVGSDFTGTYYDRMWKNLTLDQVTDSELFAQLAQASVGHNQANMGTLLVKIKKKFEGFGSSPTRSSIGHQIQSNGTCTHDSFATWLESAMGNLLFRDFEIFMGDRGLVDLRSLKRIDDETQEVLAIGTKVQEQRKKELNDKSNEIISKRLKLADEIDKLTKEKDELQSKRQELYQKEKGSHRMQLLSNEINEIEKELRQLKNLSENDKLSKPFFQSNSEKPLWKKWEEKRGESKKIHELNIQIEAQNTKIKAINEKIDMKKRELNDLEPFAIQ